MEKYIVAGLAVAVSLLICFIHFKRSNYATLVLNVITISGILYLFGKTLGGLIIGIVVSLLISLFFLFWSPLKWLDDDVKED